MYKAKIKDNEYAIELGEVTTLNGKEQQLESFEYDSHAFHMKLNGQEKTAYIIRIDEEAKTLSLRIAGKVFNVQIQEPIDILLDKLGMKNVGVKKINNLKAVMPGLILKLLVQEGEKVKAGESLLILEAMKMENVFKAPIDVVIKKINVVEKQAVEKGQELITFED